jgi:hypothetical protein
MVRQFTVDEVLTTTRSICKRLDFTRSIECSLIEECFAAAQQAPTEATCKPQAVSSRAMGTQPLGHKPCIPSPSSTLPGLCELITKEGREQ